MIGFSGETVTWSVGGGSVTGGLTTHILEYTEPVFFRNDHPHNRGRVLDRACCGKGRAVIA